MIVITATNIPDRLRGKLSVWCAQVNPNTFVARLPSDARSLLWEAICHHALDGDVTMVFEEGNQLVVLQQGGADRVILDRHGVLLSHRLSY